MPEHKRLDYEIEGGVSKDDLPPERLMTMPWAPIFQDVISRLNAQAGLVIPVRFHNIQDARGCRQAYSNRVAPARRGRFRNFPKNLKASQRGEHVFFWLEPEKEPADA